MSRVKQVIISLPEEGRPRIWFLMSGAIENQLVKVECSWLHFETATQFAQDLANQLTVPLQVEQ